ncbi:hypothetical protein L596_016889 [Steinernema carpocapsae]|uniref:Sec16 Sec23-binding domain-containing protein n=1 Tax=Steinernema carpocapsae TaxID=34508 RepID=A0A4U5NJD9_STECR|nr:hypothetical protein L596_016889 [Steinernema carpocapsae]
MDRLRRYRHEPPGREEDGSADELEQFNRNSAAMHQPNYADPYVQEEAYYYGVIKLRPKDVYEKQAANPPPEGYLHLKPIERVAYMFYYELYNDYFNPIERFSMLFNRELYKYKCEGLNDAAALEKICKHTADEYKMENEQRKKEKSKAYDRTQKQLFSDDRATPDSRMGGSVYDPVDDSLDLASIIDSAPKEPMKHRRDHHSVLNFTADGRLVSIDPASLTNSDMPFVKIMQVRNYVNNAYTRGLIEAMDGFKVPFNLNAPDDVADFLEKQISRIMHSDVFQNNHSSGDATDCWLIWSLLSMLVQKRGTVTGRDLAGLLMRAVAASETDAAKSGFVDPDMNEDQLRLRVSVNQLMLKGRIREVIELAEREGVFEAEAFALARRLERTHAANVNQELYLVDTVQLDNLEAKVLSRWPAASPLRIFMNVATYSDASLTNLSPDDPSSWRVHAAVVLANVEFLSDKAIKSIYQLGRTLANRDFHCAADFCFLTGNLLANYNPFQPVEATSDYEAYVRQHIDLIHATIPDDSINSCITSYGWSLGDLQATEIYYYALQLAFQGQPNVLSYSIAFQVSRMQYAEMMAQIAGMSSAAFEYFYVILLTIWNTWGHFPSDKVLHMCEMAERLKFSVPGGEERAQAFRQMRKAVHEHLAHQLSSPAIEYPAEPLQQPVDISSAQVCDISRNVQHDVEYVQADPEPVEEAEEIHHEEVIHVSQKESAEFITGNSETSTSSSPSLEELGCEPTPAPAPEPEKEAPILEVPELVFVPKMKKPSATPTAQFSPLPDTSSTPKSTFPNAQRREISPKKEKKVAKGGGWFSGITSKLAKVIPSSNEMKLPDDRNQEITWDANLNRWVGAGTNQSPDAGKPPTIPMTAQVSAPTPSAPISIPRSVGSSQRTRYTTASYNPQPPRGGSMAAPQLTPGMQFGGFSIPDFNFVMPSVNEELSQEAV